MTDLSTFINETAVILLKQLPLQSLDSSVNYIYQYISNNGGWVPDDPLHPNADGHVDNDFTEQQVADAITNNEFNAVYSIDLTVTTDIHLHFAEKLTDGLTLDAAAASVQNHVSHFITTAVNTSPIPLRVESTSTQVTVPSNSMVGGYTTQTIRQNIASGLSLLPGTKDVNYKALALLYVRNTYGVDDTWSVHSVYTETDTPIAVIIKKYIDNTYAALDVTSTKIYVINVSPTTYQVVTGVIVTT